MPLTVLRRARRSGHRIRGLDSRVRREATRDAETELTLRSRGLYRGDGMPF
jgi:hypothetical protein